ncbi:MAG TPA: NFACT family protein, partial [Planctomycetota bacterium]|nr:NFACT family protein [Planctomycetota bacterium]
MAELAHLLSACVLRAVQALPPRDLLLIFEPGQGGPGASDEDPGPPPRLRLSADPSSPRLHLQHTRVPGHDGPAGPFYLLLEEHLAGATLASISQVRGDRIVLLEFRDTPLGGRRALLAELTGRGANIFLLGPGDRLESSLAPLPSPPPDSTRRQRLLSPGQPWTPPTAPPPPSSAGTQSLAQALAEDLPGPPEEPPSGRGAPRTPAPL